ncbi:MAG: S41 family peptidase [Gemmataceae bacterium]
MHRALGMSLLALTVGLLGSPAIRAEQEADAPKKYVVLVGVSDYGDAQIKQRKTAERDAAALYDLFNDGKYFEGDKEIHLLLGKADEGRKSQTANKANILKALSEVTAKARKDDLVIVALIGQGAPLGDKTCFLAADSTFKDRAANAISSDELEKAVKDLKSQKLVALIDVNLKGYDAGKEVLPDPNLGDLLRVFIGNEDKEEHTLPPGRVVLLSGNGFSQPLEYEGQGLFVKTLIKGLQGAADSDVEPDGTVSVSEIDAYLEKEMPKIARQIGKTAEEKEQASIDWGARINHFGLTSNPEVRTRVLAQIAKLDSFKLDPEAAADGRRLLERVPKLKAEQELRKAYQSLVAGTIAVEELSKQRAENLAARKLSEEDAREFADRVFLGVEMVRRQYVKELNAGEMVNWAIRGLYRKLEIKTIPTEIKEKLDKVKDARSRELKDLLTEVRVQLGKREDLANKKDVDIAMMMMMANLDPYTTYIDKEQKDKAEMEFKGRFYGIGIQIRRSSEKNALLVVSPIKDSPAYKAKLMAGDLITEIVTDKDDKGRELPSPQKFSTQDMKTETAVKHILGKEGTEVSVTVQREGEAQPRTFTLKRGLVQVETVLGAKRKDDDTWDFYIDPVNKIGYIHLTQFAPNSYRDMLEAVKKLDRSGLKGLVLDLRNNPGGLLDQAVNISDMFIDDGLIVTIRPRVGQEMPYYGQHEGSFEKFPMVCLINNGSASGSEIVAGCLQDHKRAIVLGERSYGKGSVQHIQPFASTDGEIKLTTASFWRPNMKNLNKTSVKDYKTMTPEQLEKEDWGVRPDSDYEVKLDRKERFDLDMNLREREIIPRREGAAKEPKPPFVDRQLEKALEYLRSNMKTAKNEQGKKAG